MMTSISEPIRIFIGSSPKNTIEEAVFRYTLQKYTTSAIEIHVINGQAGTATNLNTGEVKSLPPNLIGRIPGATAFSLGRWAIPEWCGYRGKAIYCDSDQVLLADLAQLWNFDLSGCTLAAVPVKQAKSATAYIDSYLQTYLNVEDDYYLASVMLIDCEKAAQLSLSSLVEAMDRQAFSMSDLMYLGETFRQYLGVEVKTLPSEWNHLDYVDGTSKLVHFTNLDSQPWRFHHHPIAQFWEDIFLDAIAENAISQETVKLAYANGWITARIKAIAALDQQYPESVNQIWRRWSRIRLAIARFFTHQIKRVKFVLSRLSERSASVENAGI
jgi:lipopolysaccharide biosynthesis glycosyltransferase